jgi:hypothetical protein
MKKRAFFKALPYLLVNYSLTVFKKLVKWGELKRQNYITESFIYLLSAHLFKNLFKKCSVKNFHSHLSCITIDKWEIKFPKSLKRLYKHCFLCYLQAFNAVFNRLQGGLVYA